jgi:DNA-binding CsgD family transcriptional regulator
MNLLERDRFLAELDGLLREAAAGQGHLVLVGGEAGVGKTALVGSFCATARGRARVLIGACDPLSTPRPLGPLQDIAVIAGGELDRLLERGAPRDRLFRACLAEFGGGLMPTLAVVEDAHWADEASLDLLRFLGRRIDGTRALLVVTYRDDEVGPRHPLRLVLGDLATAQAVRRLSLPPLSEGAVRTLAVGSGLDPGELHRLTGGNPFFVTEILAAGKRGLPATVRDAVLARAGRLSPNGRALLEAAAVLGSPLAPDVLAAVAGEAIAAVEECLTSGVLREAGDQLAFRHELARAAILASTPPARRTALHRRALAAWRASPPDAQDPARLAHHAEEAGDREAILAYAPAAAARAEALGANREAAAQYQRALRYADGLPDERRAELLIGQFRACYVTGLTAPAVEACQALRDLARRRDDPALEAEALARLSWALVIEGRNVEAEAASSASLAAVEPLPLGPAHLIPYRFQTYLRMLNRDNAEAIAFGERAITLAERHDDRESLAHLLNAVGSARLLAGDEGAGRAELERSQEVAAMAGLDTLYALAFGNLGSSFGEVYRFDLADRYLTEGIAYSVERDFDSFRLYMTSWLALTRCYQGRWNEAADLADWVIGQPNATAISRTMAYLALGRVRARRGDPDAWTALDAAWELAEPTGTLQRIGPVRAARAEAAWLAGDPARSSAEARAALELAARHRHPWHLGELGFWLWRAGELDEPPPGAAEPFALQVRGDWAGAAAAWEARGCPYEAARARADAPDEAVLREALIAFERLGARPAAATVARKLRDLGARGIPRGPRPTTRANPANLTPRELEVLALVVEGRRNTEIADRLFLSPKTVDHHVSALLAKLGVHARGEAAAAAARLGIPIPIPTPSGSTQDRGSDPAR